ncbi:MAG: DUF1636 domain-containing protein [Myxococcaceae bacterium]|nr:DUF1636 domain-containing protein [Myxococcaceae bacterium]
MKRPVLKVCVSCFGDDDRLSGERFFKRLKKERRERGLKPLFKLEPVRCLGGCDTPCNAKLKAEGRPTFERTWLHAKHDVAALVDAAARYARGAALEPGTLPGRPG